MRHYKVILWSLLSLITFSDTSFGQQIFSVSDTGMKTDYTATDIQDTIYIFYGTNEISPYVEAIPASSGNDWGYSWYKFNDTTRVFDLLDSTNSKITNLIDGGYQVIMHNNTNTEPDDTVTAWVFKDDWEVWLTKRSIDKDARCYELHFDVNRVYDSLFYYFDYHGDMTDSIPINNDIKIGSHSWSIDNEPENWDAKNGTSSLYISFSNETMPTEPIEITYKMTDSLGQSISDTYRYKTAIAVKADFDTEAQNTEGSVSITGVQNAPLELLFTNNSSSTANDYTWSYTTIEDTTRIEFSTDETPLGFTLKKPGQYKIQLKAYNDLCKDSLIYKIIEIASSSLEAPKAFNPDRENFKFTKDSSINELSIRIFTRNGKLVHKFEGNYANWRESGWDGKVKNSNRSAPPGIYFYVIEGVGFDNRTIVRKGFVYLFRQKN